MKTTNEKLFREASDAGLIAFRVMNTKELEEYLGVSTSRVMALLNEGRVLGVKFTSKCWVIPLDPEGRPFASIGAYGPKPAWADKVHVLASHTYRRGRKRRSAGDKLDEVEAALSSL